MRCLSVSDSLPIAPLLSSLRGLLLRESTWLVRLDVWALEFGGRLQAADSADLQRVRSATRAGIAGLVAYAAIRADVSRTPGPGAEAVASSSSLRELRIELRAIRRDVRRLLRSARASHHLHAAGELRGLYNAHEESFALLNRLLQAEGMRPLAYARVA